MTRVFQIPRCLSPERREVSTNLRGKRYCAGSNSRFGQPLQWGGRAFQRYRYMRTYLRYTCSIIFNHVQLATGNHLTLRLGVDDCRLRPAAAVHGYSMLAKVSSCNPQFLMFSICTCVQGNVSVFRSRSVKMETPPKRIRTEAIWGTFNASSFTDQSLSYLVFFTSTHTGHKIQTESCRRRIGGKVKWWNLVIYLVSVGCPPSILPRPGGFHRGHEGTHRPMSLCLGALGWMEDHQGGQPCHWGTKNPRPCLWTCAFANIKAQANKFECKWAPWCQCTRKVSRCFKVQK